MTTNVADYKVLRPEAIQAAFDYLNEKSEAIGIARANEVRARYMVGQREREAKQVFARLFLVATGSSVDNRKMWATCHEDYINAQERISEAEERHAVAIQAWENTQDSRNRANMIIEAWRTAEASGRQIRQLR